MKLIHTKALPVETIHKGTLFVNRIISVGQSTTMLQTLNRASVPSGKSTSPHKHDDCEEMFYFLDGTGEVIVEDKAVSVSKDDVVIVELGEKHEIRNTSSANLTYLSMRILL